jgi:hypothetical protein
MRLPAERYRVAVLQQRFGAPVIAEMWPLRQAEKRPAAD